MAISYLILLLIPAIWILYNVYCLILNYLEASRLGLKTIIVPVSPENPLWIAIQTGFGAILHYLPLDAFSFTKYCHLGWEFRDRYRTHLRLGDAWILVTPTRNWLFVANASAVNEILSRSKDFLRPVWMLEVLSVFGPNVSNAEGADWQRQRKLTATPFNESKSVLVWNEALRQANDMLSSWLSKGPNGHTSTSDDTRTLALHVLAFVAFQKSYPFRSVSKTKFEDAKSMTYRDSLATILDHAFQIMILPHAIFSIPFTPKSWRQIGWAIKGFREHMMKELTDEKQRIANGEPGSGTLVSNLVRASDEGGGKTNAGLKPLTEAEILGNLFVFNFAGHDTTSISLSYGLLLMAAHPEVQDWVHEELQQYLGDKKPSEWDYNEAYPKMKRCQAILLETLRLYNPLPGLSKHTGPRPQNLTIGDKQYLIPARTLVIPDLQASHTYPRHWGNDSLTWRPQRWITNDPSTPEGLTNTQFPPETFKQLPKTVFFPWSEGMQSCPGKKFAQVEFVAVMATLFTKHRAEPVPNPGEDMSMARKRLVSVVEDSTVELLLTMRNPRSVAVRWMKR